MGSSEGEEHAAVDGNSGRGDGLVAGSGVRQRLARRRGFGGHMNESLTLVSEQERIHSWKVDQFVRMNFALDVAEELAKRRVDCHDASKLLEQGCSHELAVEILV